MPLSRSPLYLAQSGASKPCSVTFSKLLSWIKKKDPKDTVSSYSALLWQVLNKYLLSEWNTKKTENWSWETISCFLKVLDWGRPFISWTWGSTTMLCPGQQRRSEQGRGQCSVVAFTSSPFSTCDAISFPLWSHFFGLGKFSQVLTPTICLASYHSWLVPFIAKFSPSELSSGLTT